MEKVYKMTIIADKNDCDYVRKIVNLTIEELALITPVINAIKAFTPYMVTFSRPFGDVEWEHEDNYPDGEALRTDLNQKSTFDMYGHLEGYDFFNNNCVPYSEIGIHTITTISISPILNEIILL